MWSVPSGEIGNFETYEDCCVREIAEETGYVAKVVDKLWVKKGSYEEMKISFEVHYFSAQVISGERRIQDPDHLIYDVAWKSSEEIRNLDLTYPEDRQFLLDFLSKWTDTY